jgi:uncharacterized DUF497 family protein
MAHDRFEWDADKAAASLAKHLVAFPDAATMPADPFVDRFHVEVFDSRNSTEDEDRWRTVGSYPFDRGKVLVVIWSTRLDELKRPVTRIISARSATRAERRSYETVTRKR